MLDSRDIVERNFNKETQRIIGEVQLHHYGTFLEKYHESLKTLGKKLYNSYHIYAKPITIQIVPREDITLLQLVHSDNKLLSRILVSLASLCHEISTLVGEANEHFYNTFMYYGEDQVLNKSNKNIGKYGSELMEILQKVNFFVTRSEQVIILMLKQICAIIGKGLYTNNTTTSFPEPFICLSEILTCLLTLDSLLNSNLIKEHWNIYRRAVRSMSHNPKQFNIKVEDIRALDRKLLELDTELLSGTIFQRTLEKCMTDSVVVAVKSCNLTHELLLSIQQMLSELEKDDDNISFTQVWLQVNALFVLYYHLYGNIDKKAMKRLLEINKKVSACTISGNILWYPELFLLKHIPIISKQLDVKSIKSNRSSQIAQRSLNLIKESHILCYQACFWLIQIEKLTKKDMCKFKIKQLQDTSNVIIESIKFITKISELIKWITNLHADEGRPMTKSVLLALCKLIELLKCFQFSIRQNVIPLSYVILLITQHLTHKGLAILANIKKSLIQDKTYKEQQLDVLSALVVAEHALKGPNTDERILVAKLALSASGLQNEQLNDIRAVINRLQLVSRSTTLLNKLASCSFLYWHPILFPVYFAMLVDKKADMTKSYLILGALTDCKNVGDRNLVVKPGLINPLNQLVETHLRLQTHLHLQLPSTNPFENMPPQPFNKINPILLNDAYINIKQEVEHYLSMMFYNLTTVVLHDWRTYGEMRRLAMLQYGLNTVEDSLPMQTLEQGLDVLEIMRNINVFVGKYLYNLNNQIFVEEWSNNKHLNTINISHVANSIRTHGIGIMSTTVNFTYQFLQNKFFIFSQFMFDEHIKSRLLKDIRYFADHKNESNQLYPYARAEKFNFDIRKLGLDENGMSYLDLFRKVITHIGNAMGYVRLIRSGGKRCVADATCFLPDLKAVDELNKLIDEANHIPELTVHAANCLKRDIKNLVDNFEEATEYFKLLVQVFAPAFRDPKNMHLKNFYSIVPPLTINFIEHSLTSKDRLNKKNRQGAAFTDDGFAMGLAYIIELLDQTKQLKSLHWFQSVAVKQMEDARKLDAQRGQMHKDDVKLQQTLSLTEKRIHVFEKEFQLLYYSFNSASIFFQT